MDYDYSKLSGKIKEVFGTQEAFAKAMDMGKTTVSLKMNNHTEWTQAEMTKAMDLLRIPHTSVRAYFFTHKV